MSIYSKDFLNKPWGMLHIKQMLCVWGEGPKEKKEKKKFPYKCSNAKGDSAAAG